MNIEKERIENKIKELERIKENFVNQLNSVCGGIQVLKELLRDEAIKNNGSLVT